MGRQRRLVLLLVICVSALQLIHSSQAKTYDVVDKDEMSNELFSEEELDAKKAGLKIATPKVKVPLATATNKTETTTRHPVSDETIMDLFEAAKHNIALADDPRFNKMLPDRLKPEHSTTNNSSSGSSSKSSTEENYEYDEDDDEYNLDNYDSTDIEKEDDDDVKETTTVRPKKAKSVKKTAPKLMPIDERTVAKSTVSRECN